MAKIIFLTEEVIKAGGIVRVVNMWANHFVKKGNSVKIIAGRVENPYYEFDSKIKMQKWSFAFQKKIVGIPYNIIQTYRLLKSFKNKEHLNIVIDRAIHVEPIWFLRKLGLFKNINLIYFAHGGSSDFRDFYMSRPLVKHRVKMMFDSFDKVICLFDDEDDYPKEVKREKLYFIANPLPFEPSNIELNEKENIVLSLGRVTKEKGIDTLLYAWKILENKTMNWKLQIVGDGRDKENFILLSQELKVDNVEFISSTSGVKPFYEKAKVFVIPSVFEGFGMTIIEAMACKCCVISTKTAGGNKLVNHNETGVLVNIGAKEELAKELEGLLGNEERIDSLSKNAFKYVQQYKIENIAEKWNKVLV
jgi:glycosyltransferase involved in cell wall biosynthesis